MEQAQREALEATRQEAAQEAEHQRLAAEEAARHQATLYKYTRIGNWLPDDISEVFEALCEDYVQEIIGCRSHLMIEDEQRIRSQVKQIRNEAETAKQTEIAKFNATKAVELAEAERQ